MADEVLKIITLADVSGAITELKKLDIAIKNVGETRKKTQQDSKTTAASLLAPLPPIGNILGPEFEKARAGLDQLRSALGTTGETAAEAMSHMGALGPVLTAIGGPITIVAGAITAQAIALGAFTTAVVDAGVTYHDVMATMAGRTGETGDALEGLGRDFIQVFSGVPQSANEVAEVMAKLHQRFDLTGGSLQEVSRMMLDFSRITGTPVKTAMDSLVDVMSSWDLKAQDMPRLIDMMTVAFQRSGVEIPKMAGYLESNDAALKQFGFSLTESIALIATLEKRGVNVQKIMTGFNRAAPAFAEAGIDPAAGFQNALQLIKELDNEHALLIAKQVFGAKVAVEFADAIRSGAFDTFEMTLALEESAGALELAAAHSMTLTDELKLMQHAVQSLLTPLGSELVNTIEKYAIPAFAVLLFKISETVYWMEYLAGITPTLSNLDIARSTHTGLKGAAPAMGMTQMAELSGKGPARRSGPSMSFNDFMSRMKDRGSASRVSAEKAIDPEKFDRDFRMAEFRIFETFDRAGDTFDKNWTARLRGTADQALKAMQEEEKVAKELEEQNERAAARTQQLEDKLSLIRARTAGGTRQEGELFELLEQQRQERRGVAGKDLAIIEETQQFEQLALMQKQYDDTFSKIKTQAEGVFDAIFLRGKKGFAGLLDYIKGTFITGLKDMFGNLVATIFTGARPGGGSAAQGGLFGGLFSGIAGLFGGGRQGGGGGGILGSLGSVFGGGGGIAGTPPFLPARGGLGGLGNLLGLGGTGASLATGGAALTPGVAASLPTTFANTGLLPAGGTAGGAASSGSFFGLSGAQLGAFFTNPFTIAAGIGIAATVAFLKLRKTREEKFRGEILRDFAINVPDSKILKQIKQAGEAAFGRDADRKRFETLRLNDVQGLLLNYATASGQDPSRLPIYQKFYGGGLGTAARSVSFDPSRGIPAFQYGTAYVPRTGLAMVHQGEAIIPAAQNRGGGGGDTYNINISGAVDPQATARVLEEAVMRINRKNNRPLTRLVGKTIGADYRRQDILGGLIGT